MYVAIYTIVMDGFVINWWHDTYRLYIATSNKKHLINVRRDCIKSSETTSRHVVPKMFYLSVIVSK